jgi:hypothetical protein
MSDTHSTPHLLVTSLQALGVLCFVGAAFFLFIALAGNERERYEGWFYFGCLTSVAVLYFAFSKVIEYLFEILSEMKISNARQAENIKALQWIIDNWKSRE